MMDHFLLFRLIRGLDPWLVILDSEFVLAPNAVIRVMPEETGHGMNAIATAKGFARPLIGVTCHTAMELMADVLGHDCDWLDWDAVLPGRGGRFPTIAGNSSSRGAPA